MSDSFTETTSQGWLSRIGGAIKGIIVGLIMIVVAFPVLWLNEGRAVKTRKDLEQGAGQVVTVDAAKVDASNEGKLVHLTGMATSDGKHHDEAMGVKAEGLVMMRQVEMYQWKEKKSSESKKKLGGSKETKTTYSYEKVWAEGRIDSSQFKKPSGHENPQPAVSSQKWYSDPVHLGGFILSNEQIDRIQGRVTVSLNQAKLPKKIADRKPKVKDSSIYLSQKKGETNVGDIRITYTVVPSSEISIVAQQKGTGFVPFKGDAGTNINMLSMGKQDAASMFQSAQESNKVLTWILRVVGFVVMLIGFSLVFRPLAVVADVLPIAGSIVGAGTGIVAFLLAAPLSLLTIGIAWVFYRPLIGVPLLVAALVGLFFLVKKLASSKKKA